VWTGIAHPAGADFSNNPISLFSSLLIVYIAFGGVRSNPAARP